MIEPAVPRNEEERLQSLLSYQILDTSPEAAFDDLTALVSKLLKVPIALVSLVDRDRQWFKSKQGVDLDEAPRSTSFCGHVVADGEALVVPDTLEDERFFDNPLVLGPPNVRFYAGFPLRNPEGFVLGTLCAIDLKKRELKAEELELIEILAAEAVTQLELKKTIRALAEERARLSGIFEAAVEPILSIDKKGRVSDVNQAAIEMFGFSREELTSKQAGELVVGGIGLGELRSWLQSIKRGGVGYSERTIELECRREDGSVFPCAVSLGKVTLNENSGFIAIARDISVRREAERVRDSALSELRKSRDDLLLVLEHMGIGILAVDVQGIISYSNTAADKITGALALYGEPWENALPIGPRAKETITQMWGRPEKDRSRVLLELHSGERKNFAELEIVNDPRNPDGRFFHLHDVSEVFALRDEVAKSNRGKMIGDSASMRSLYEAIEQVSVGDWNVLIEGETGAGKELVAQAIHQTSPRRSGPFIAVNCAGLTESILGSQLFGYTKGAFTGAVTDRKGFFEAAEGGTLFLDEIGDVGMATQGALLRALQEREIVRLGDTKAKKIDVRVITATNRSLPELVEKGLFREDLLYRIRNARLVVPPLRNRRDDVPLLVSAFLAEERVTAGKLVTDITPPALEALAGYEWPGNVRELRAAIEHAVIRCKNRIIHLCDLPVEIQDQQSAPKPPSQSLSVTAESHTTDARTQILEALRVSGGNRSKAARLLGIGRATLYRRLSHLNIEDG